jgi:hypothetical protein
MIALQRQTRYSSELGLNNISDLIVGQLGRSGCRSGDLAPVSHGNSTLEISRSVSETSLPYVRIGFGGLNWLNLGNVAQAHKSLEAPVRKQAELSLCLS